MSPTKQPSTQGSMARSDDREHLHSSEARALVCRERSLLYRYAGKKTPGAGAHYNGIEISNSDRTHARERTTITVP